MTRARSWVVRVTESFLDDLAWRAARSAVDAVRYQPRQLDLVLAVDMRGFSHLTQVLQDTQYLADLIGEYLTEMTEIIEGHRGIVFQYTGDGLLAIFLPELAGSDAAVMLERVVYDVGRALHAR